MVSRVREHRYDNFADLPFSRNALTADVACWFGDCVAPTAGSCASTTPAPASASATPLNYLNTTTPTLSNTWALSSAATAASSAGQAATASSLQPITFETTAAVSTAATPSSSLPVQAETDAACRAVEVQGLLLIAAGLGLGGIFVLWL